MGYTVIFNGTRHCLGCNVVKALAEFSSYRYTTKQGKEGRRYSGLCRPCELAKGRRRPRLTARKSPRRPVASADHLKICSRCEQEKPRTEFYPNSRSKDGLQYDCKRCRIKDVNAYTESNIEIRRQWAKRSQLRKYGLTSEEFDAIRRRQNDECAVCHKVVALHVDHDHVTNRVRGLLCLKCNMALGLLADSPETIQSLLTYVAGG